MTRERRMEKYFRTRRTPADRRPAIRKLMLRLSPEEFDHAMKVHVELDKKPGHLLCSCSGDKPHRLKDCSKVMGPSKCLHRIKKGKNRGGFMKKSSCVECCPKNFCQHKLRRDNCHFCKRSLRVKVQCLPVKVQGLHPENIQMIDPDPSDFEEEEKMTMVDPECEDLSNVQDVQGQGFNVQGLEDVEDSPLVKEVGLVLFPPPPPPTTHFPLVVQQSLQDDQDDVQHVPFPYFLLLEEGSHF